MTTPPLKCAFCNGPCDSYNYCVYRDGHCKGPVVPLCAACGRDPAAPSMQEIWAKIANPEPLIDAMKEVTL